MPEPTPETLSVWLQDVVATVPDAAALKAFHEAVALGAKVTNTQMLDVVALAYRAAHEDKIQWYADLARSKGAPVPLNGNEALVTRLAAASAVGSATSGNASSIVTGLAAQSAGFLGLTPDLPEVATFADDAVAKAADVARRRTLSYEAIATKVPGWVDEAIAPPAEGVTPSDRPQWEAPAVAIARQLDGLASEVLDRFALLDEEYNLLWWSHAGRSLTADADWGDVDPPALRVVLVGMELGEQARIPATPMVDGLAAVALGDVAEKHVALADVVLAARDQSVGLATFEHTLLPISTAVTQANLYTEDDTWKTVVKTLHSIDVAEKQSAMATARQLIREQHLGKFL
jgi:hypothetical protein